MENGDYGIDIESCVILNEITLTNMALSVAITLKQRVQTGLCHLAARVNGICHSNNVLGIDTIMSTM